MKNFLISALVDIALILIAYGIFRAVLSGPTRHKIYEKFISSFARFVIYLFVATVAITGITALILYKTRYIAYLNIVASALVSLLVGFVMSTVPTKGLSDEDKGKNRKIKN